MVATFAGAKRQTVCCRTEFNVGPVAQQSVRQVPPDAADLFSPVRHGVDPEDHPQALSVMPLRPHFDAIFQGKGLFAGTEVSEGC